MNKLLGKSVPVTLLYDWINRQERLKNGSDISDSISALFYVKGYDDGILIEKAAAGVAINRNRASLWDSHGFTNVMLILNGIPASVDYIAAVDPVFMNYAVWELTQAYPDLLIGPEAERSIMASLHTYDYPYPPFELAVVEEFMLKEYGKLSEDVGKVYKRASELLVEGPDLYEVMNRACKDSSVDKTPFIEYHVVRLLSGDHYLKRMQEEYYRWKKILEEANGSNTESTQK